MSVKSNDNSKLIPIVFATNENYAPYAGVTISSLVDNSSKDFFYDIYVFFTDLSAETISRFEQMKGENFSVKCLDVNAYINKEILYENFHFSKEMYYRILIPTILKKYKKVIYLDCDMVVLGDISELYQTDLSGYVLGGVNDIMHKMSKENVLNNLKLDPEKYINSGMLVINTAEFLKNKIKEKCFDILKTSTIKFRYPDQDIINLACQGKIKYLDPCWNYIWHYNFPTFNQSPKLRLSEEDQKAYIQKTKNIKILHYTSNVKPWSNFNTKFSNYFFKYAKKTKEFKDIIFERYNKLPRKNYIALQFFDCFGDKVVVTGTFNTIEDYLYHDKVFVNINGKISKLNWQLSRNVTINNLCYSQNLFTLTLSLNQCKKGLKVSFFRENRKTEKLLITAGKHFPIESPLGNSFYFGKCSFGVKSNEIQVKIAGRKTRKNNEKVLQKKLKNNFGRAGKKSAWLRKLYFLTKPFFRKNVWLVSDRLDSAGDNGEAFFKYLKENKPKGVKAYFVIKKSSPDHKRMKKIGKVVAPHTNKFNLLFLHAKKNISSQLDRYIIEPYFTKYLKDILAGQQTVFLQHGIIKDDLSNAYSRFNQGMDLFVTSAKAEYDSIAFNKDYGLGANNVILTGLARFDYLENNPEKIIYVLPTWRHSLLRFVQEENLTELKKSDFYKFYSEFLNNKKLVSLLDEYGYKLKFVPHELAKVMFRDFVPTSQNIEVEACNVSYQEIFKTGSILVTDYSSTAFDFAYLMKPVIYVQFDKDTIYSNHTYKPGYFEYERDGLGKVTYDLDSAINEIENTLKNNAKMDKIYLDRVKNFYAFTDRNNCERTLKEITRFDVKKHSLAKRAKLCFKEHGFKYTCKRVVAKILGRD